MDPDQKKKKNESWINTVCKTVCFGLQGWNGYVNLITHAFVWSLTHDGKVYVRRMGIDVLTDALNTTKGVIK